MLSGVGYDKSECANFLCKLNKALYGLKQTSRCWYETFVNFKSLYVGYVKNEKGYIILFVDNDKSASAVNSVIKLLKTKFEITVSEPYTFVGIEIKRNRVEKKIFLCQS